MTDTYTVDEVARLLGISPRWLADECRAERVEHVHIARKRRFTSEQVARLLAAKTVSPITPERRAAVTANAVRRLSRAGRR